MLKKIVLLLCFLLFACDIQKPRIYTPRETTKYRYNDIAVAGKITEAPLINPKTGLFSEKELRVGLLLPMTGNKQEIGQQVFDAITMAIQDLKADSVKLFVFDTADDVAKAQIAARQAVAIGVQVIIGPVFSTETKAVKEIIEPFGITMISLSNNVALASKTTYIFGVSPDNLVKASFEYLAQNDKKNIGILLSNTQSGFVLGKYLNKIAPSLKIKIMATEYYSSGNQDAIKNSIRKLIAKKSLYYLIDKDGNEYLDTINGKKPDKNSKQALPEKQLNNMDAVYLDATEYDLYQIISEIKRQNPMKDVTIMSGQNILEDPTIFKNPVADNVIFVNTATPYIYDFNISFNNLFGYKPLRIAAIAYDAFSTIATVAIKHKGDLEEIQSEDGFTGIYGDFRFRKNGIVERKYYVERINKKTIELIDKMNNFM